MKTEAEKRARDEEHGHIAWWMALYSCTGLSLAISLCVFRNGGLDVDIGFRIDMVVLSIFLGVPFLHLGALLKGFLGWRTTKGRRALLILASFWANLAASIYVAYLFETLRL